MKAKTEITVKFTSGYEVAKLLNLIRDGKQILVSQNRTQRGIDGYTSTNLSNWEKELSELTKEKCEFADSKLIIP